MKSYTFSARAKQDLTEIHDYIAQDSVRHARRFIERIEAKCQLLADFPGMGELREQLAPQLRFFTVGRYVIFYRPCGESIEIARVASGARDVAALFETDS